MPNQRASDRTNITFWADGDFLAMIEMGRRKVGRGLDRSQFIRDAIKEKLEGLGYAVPDVITLPPDRARPVKPSFIYGEQTQQQSQSQELRAAEEPLKPGEPTAEPPPKSVRYPKSKKPKP